MTPQPLPQVVEFDHRHAVKVINDGHITRIIATPSSKYPPKYRQMHDLPFTGKAQPGDHWRWWYFPKASSHAEVQQRGEYFWECYVRFARGASRRRADDAGRLLRYVLDDMKRYPDGRGEADIFLAKLSEAVVGHLRVGVEQ